MDAFAFLYCASVYLLHQQFRTLTLSSATHFFKNTLREVCLRNGGLIVLETVREKLRKAPRNCE